VIRLGSALATACLALTLVTPAEMASARDLFDGFFSRSSSVRDEDERGFWSIFRRQRTREPDVEPVFEPEEPYVPPVYQPDVLQPLKDVAIDSARPETALNAEIHDLLKEGANPVIRVHPAHREAIIAFYVDRDFRPIWTGEAGLNRRAERLIGLLAKSDLEGLRPVDYLPEALGAFAPEARPVLTDLAVLARLDIELTVAAVKYAHHASAGRIVPSRLSKYIDLEPDPVDPADALTALSRTVRPEKYLAGLHPTHIAYDRFKAELAKLRKAYLEAEEIMIPEGGLIKLNDIDSRVVLIRKRLNQEGLLAPKITWITSEFDARTERDLSNIRRTTADSAVYDRDVMTAVTRFQKRRGLSADGVIGPATTRALNSDTTEKRIEKLVLNIERLRWLPRDFGKRHILVNQAAFELKLFENDELLHRARVIVGKNKHQTPAFSDVMEFVVLNPYWNVPESIATKEMLPHLLVDPYYLDDKGFEVIGRSGRVPSGSVDWETYEGQKLPFTIRQPPGTGNALGIVKFLFPNRHNVYMHDTPTKHLFDQPVRTFSHGCVRVQNADQFADIILEREGWTPQTIRDAIGTGENRRIVLKNKIAVHIAYFTAWTDGDEPTYYADMYGRDELLKRALGENRVAMK